MLKKERYIFVLWILLAAVILVWMHMPKVHPPVTGVYWHAGKHWIEGQELYNGRGTNFIYFPQSAILFAPLSLLPFMVADTIWRILSMVLFVWGLHRLAQVMFLQQQERFGTSKHFRIQSPALYFFILTLLSGVLGFSSFRNGQMNILIAGLLMLLLSYLPEKAWWRVAFILAISLALKTTAIVILLLCVTLYWSLAWRTLIFLLGFVLLPFATQSTPYVMLEYHHAINNLLITQEVGRDWAQLFNALLHLGFNVPGPVQTTVRLFLAVGVWVLCWCVKRTGAVNTFVLMLFNLSMCYLILFNPRTEGNDYVFLAPALGWLIIYSIGQMRYWLTGFWCLCLLGLACGYQLSTHLMAGHHTAWTDPLIALIITLFVVKDTVEYLKK